MRQERCINACILQIEGDIHPYRSFTSRQRRMDGLIHDDPNIVWIVQHHRIFCDWLYHADDVCLLRAVSTYRQFCICSGFMKHVLPGDKDHGHVVLPRTECRCDGIRRRTARRNEASSKPPLCLCIGHRCIRRTLFMIGRDWRETCFPRQCIRQEENPSTRHKKDVANARLNEASHHVVRNTLHARPSYLIATLTFFPQDETRSSRPEQRSEAPPHRQAPRRQNHVRSPWQDHV